MTLEIKVKESIELYDSVGDVLNRVEEIIYNWEMSDTQEPLVITLRKVESTGPPALGISVGETIKHKDALA